MKRLFSVLLVLLGFAAGLAACRFWTIKVEEQEVDRTMLYARLVDEAIAAEAGPSTLRLFRTLGPRRPGWTTGPIQPCPLDQAALRSDGPGQCFHANIGYKDLPLYCVLSPCVDVDIDEAAWNDPAVRRAIDKLRRDPGAVCRVAEEHRTRPWREWRLGPVIDCGRWKVFRGTVLVRVFRDGTGPGQLPVEIRTIRLV